MSPIIDFVVGEAARLLAITVHGVAGLTETAARATPLQPDDPEDPR